MNKETITTALEALRYMQEDSRAIRLSTTAHHHRQIMERVAAAIADLEAHAPALPAQEQEANGD